MKIYHATPISNLDNIKKYGLHSRFGGGVFFSENPTSAARWVGLSKPGLYAVLEVQVKNKKGLQPGYDHAPIMEMMFPGKVWVSMKPKYCITKVVIYDVQGNKPWEVEIVDTQSGFTATNKTDDPFEIRDNTDWEKIRKELKNFLNKQIAG
jgi:hypothetical protein